MLESRGMSILKSKVVVYSLIGALTVILGSVLLYAQSRRGTGNFGPTGANPAYIIINSPTLVTFTSQITDRKLKKRSVILLSLDASGQPAEIRGRLKDDGKNGDSRANDSIYTFRTTLTESNVGSINFQIAARFKPGKWTEPEPDDDDWDKDLADSALSRQNRDNPTKRQYLLKLLKKLTRYTLSTPIQVTVDPFLLPPDPGEAGKQTLEGIDSDHDGVRDDIQRWIGINYQASEKRREALRQDIKSLQRFILGANDKESSRNNAKDMERAWECEDYIFGTLDDAIMARDRLEPQFLNTEARSRAYIKANSQLGGTFSLMIPEDQRKAQCRFDPDLMEN